MSKLKSEKKKEPKQSIWNSIPSMIEPLKENRFLIEMEGADIPSYLFRKYKLYNEAENYILETSFYETVQYQFNPKDFLNIVGVTVSYLDPTDQVVNGLNLPVKGSNFQVKSSYKRDGLQTVKMRFVIEPEKINLLTIKTGGDE